MITLSRDDMALSIKDSSFFLPQIFQECFKYYCFIISTTIVIDDFGTSKDKTK